MIIKYQKGKIRIAFKSNVIELTKSEYAKTCVFTVVIGSSYPHTDALHEFVEETKISKSII